MWTSDKAFFLYFVIIILGLLMWLASWSVDRKAIQFESGNCQPTNYFSKTRGGWLSPVYKCDTALKEEKTK